MTNPPRTLALADLHDTGMLWLINKVVFHPRGFALAMVMHEGQFAHWALLGDGSEPWQFEEPTDHEQFARAEATFRAARGGAAGAREIVAQRFRDDRGVDSDIAAARILDDLVKAGHLPSAYGQPGVAEGMEP